MQIMSSGAGMLKPGAASSGTTGPRALGPRAPKSGAGIPKPNSRDHELEDNELPSPGPEHRGPVRKIVEDPFSYKLFKETSSPNSRSGVMSPCDHVSHCAPAGIFPNILDMNCCTCDARS